MIFDGRRSASHLGTEALGLYFFQGTNEPEKCIHGRQQALANMISGEFGRLEERDLETFAHEGRGSVAASRPATNNEDLSFGRLKYRKEGWRSEGG